jgi:uncharacterized membrane protein (UPF0127 family)
MVRRAFFATLLWVVVVAGLACGESETSQPSPTGALPERVTVTVGGASFEAEVSETTGERILGLGERDSLAADTGMLFVFNAEGEHGFWMKGMRFPLDFVWISADRQVVALTENVQPQEPGTEDGELELFDEDTETQYVLEVNAGAVAQSDIALGDPVTIEPDIDPRLAQ